MLYKLLKVLKFRLFPSFGTATCLSVLQLYYFGSLAFKTIAFFEISSLFIIKSSVDHASYKYYVLGMVKQIYFNIHPIFWPIGHKSSGNCRNFVVCILHIVSMYSHIQIVHVVGSLVLKPMAIIEISSFSLASYVASYVTYIQIQNLYYFTIGLARWL